MSRPLGLLVVCGAIIIAATWYWVHASKPDQQLNFAGESLTLLYGNDRVSEFYLENASKMIKVSISRSIRVDDARRIIRERMYQFGSLFQKQRVGYKGQHTEFIQCAGEFKPQLNVVEMMDGSLHYFSGFASDRFVPGACDRESASQEYVNFALFCASDEILIEGEFFVRPDSANSVEQLVRQISCAGF